MRHNVGDGAQWEVIKIMEVGMIGIKKIGCRKFSLQRIEYDNLIWGLHKYKSKKVTKKFLTDNKGW